MQNVNLADNTATKNMEEYFKNFEHLPYGVAIIKNDAQATLVKANNAFYNTIGFTKEEFLDNHNNSMLDILIDDFINIVRTNTTGEDYDRVWNLRIRTASGEIRLIHDEAHYDASLDEFFVTFIDITDKMITSTTDLSYDAFLTKHEVLLYLSKYTSKYIVVADLETDKIVYLSEDVMDLYGFEKESDWHGKTYKEIGFGSEDENVPLSYYEPLHEDRFRTIEYFNKHHNLYSKVNSKIITIPALNRKMRLSIITDITAQKKLERKLESQETLRKCVDTLFHASTTENDSQVTFDNILHEIKTYYQADRAFFYKFKTGTNEIENFYEVAKDGLKMVNMNLPKTATTQQIEQMQAVAKEKVVQASFVLDFLDRDEQERLAQLYQEYQIDSFACLEVKDAEENLLAFMGITNPKVYDDSKEMMELLSHSICMYIEYQETQMFKADALKIEDQSRKCIVETCVKSFKNLSQGNENINKALNLLCNHYDADFAILMLKQEDGYCVPTHIVGSVIPDLEPLQSKANVIMERWETSFKTYPQFLSNRDVPELNQPERKKVLFDKYGIYNFVVSQVCDANGDIKGLLFVNNFQFINRSRLLVHIVANNISDYLIKLEMHEMTQLEPATKLFNKVATQNQISELLESGIGGTLFIIDIDHFKELNDTLGHAYGDMALMDLANSLRSVFRASDIIGRVGGDEFMVFSQGLSSSTLLKQKAQQILELGRVHYEKQMVTADISVSIGVCTVDDNCKSYQTIYEKADRALYSAKRAGKNQYHIYVDKESVTNDENRN